MNNTNNTNNSNRKRHHHGHGRNRTRQRFTTEKISINKVYDSNGPSGRQRGNASTLYEKYTGLARDAHSAGDRILSENYMQYAEHYLRIINSIQEQMQSVYRDPYSSDIKNTDNAEYFDDTMNEQQNDQNFVSQIQAELPQYQETKLEQSISDDFQKDRGRRKVYPYARRKSYDGYNNHSATPSFQDETDKQIPIVPIENFIEKVQKDDMSPVLSDNTQPSESIKRRVVRRRILTQEKGDNSAGADIKNISSEE